MQLIKKLMRLRKRSGRCRFAIVVELLVYFQGLWLLKAPAASRGRGASLLPPAGLV